MSGSICALVGGQFGSEGKGLIASEIATDYDVHVRVGAANAGHTLYTGARDGVDRSGRAYREKHVMQQLPCAAYAHPHADLVIGPGALISPHIFVDEMKRNAAWRREHGYLPARIFVDKRAHVITDEQIEREQQTGLAERIGSTSTIAREGIGTAAADRVLRAESCVMAFEYDWQALANNAKLVEGDVPGFVFSDVPALLDRRWRSNQNILLEGTQGTGLSNTTGFFPYCTSRNTTAAGLAADSGVAPNRVDRVIVVFRTYPIRVAGPSGPFDVDSEEISWDALGIDPENERTTVTKKVRRVATFSWRQLTASLAINGATEAALTFADYLDPTIACGSGNWTVSDLENHPKVLDHVERMEDHGARVTFIGTGPYSVICPALEERIEEAA